jgi:hypothetical protein
VSLTAARPDAPPAPQPAEVDAPSPAGAVAAGSDLASRARADGIEFIMALFVDLTGKPCAKLVPIEAVEEPKDPDLMALPDPTSYLPVLFIRPGLAIVHCDPHVEGHPWPYAPRIILEAQLARAAELGLELKVGAEVEYSPRCRRPGTAWAGATTPGLAPLPGAGGRGRCEHVRRLLRRDLGLQPGHLGDRRGPAVRRRRVQRARLQDLAGRRTAGRRPDRRRQELRRRHPRVGLPALPVRRGRPAHEPVPLRGPARCAEAQAGGSGVEA